MSERRPGRPAKQDGPAHGYPVKLSAARRARYQRLADAWGVPLSDAIRRAVDEACEREQVS